MSEEESVVRVFGVTKVRPHFGPKQLRTLRGIKVGKFYRDKSHYYQGHGSKIKVVDNPFQKKDKTWWVKVIVFSSDTHFESDQICLADHGVCPYENGKWNRTNWLKRMG